ncbi:MAG: HAD family phosphatase [Clostridia bacterium]|nr:HAD family phosphatase [Clostridia bacterium]
MQNYIFDFGMVLFNYDTKYMAGLYTENEEDRDFLESVVFDRLYWDQLDRGEITDSEVIEAIRQRIPERLAETAVKIYNNWIENLTPIPGMEDLLVRIKNKGGRLYLLSNTSIGFARTYRNVPSVCRVLSLFDGLVFSGPLHMAKPDPAIFRFLLEKYRLSPEETLFTDDNPKNIEAAKQLGLHTFLFDGDSGKLLSVAEHK